MWQISATVLGAVNRRFRISLRGFPIFSSRFAFVFTVLVFWVLFFGYVMYGSKFIGFLSSGESGGLLCF